MSQISYSLNDLPSSRFELLNTSLSTYQNQILNVEMGKARKLGHYGLSVDKMENKRTFIPDDSKLTFLVKLPQNVDIDLQDGPAIFREKINWGAPGNAKIDELLQCLISKQALKAMTVRDARPEYDFLTYRGVLTKILVTPYVRDDWLIGACLHKGSIYLCPYYTPQVFASEEDEGRMNSLSYAGYRFEHALTSDQPGHQGLNLEPFSPTLSEYSVLLERRLKFRSKQYNLLYAAEIDCLDVGKTREDQDDLKNFVEIKTMNEIKNESHFRSMMRFRLIKWWAQSFLVDIPKLVVGYKTHNLHVKTIEETITSDIPRRCRNFWSKQKCLDFLFSFLDFVHEILTNQAGGDQDPGQVYLFSPDFHSKKIYVRKLHQADQFEILPSWYLEKFAGFKRKVEES